MTLESGRGLFFVNNNGVRYEPKALTDEGASEAQLIHIIASSQSLPRLGGD